MKRTSLFIVLLLAATLAWAQPSGHGTAGLPGVPRAEGPAVPGAKPAVDALVKQLSSDDPAAREAATKALVEAALGGQAFLPAGTDKNVGPAIVEALDRARKESKDEDLRLRCDIILKRIAEKTGVTPQSLATDRDLKLPTSRVTLEFDKAPASDVLAELARQSGNAPMRSLNDPMGKKKISVSVRDVPYWQAVDRVCEAMRVIPQFQGDEGMTLMPCGKLQDYGALAGPASVKLIYCSRRSTHAVTKLFRPPFGGEHAGVEDERVIAISYLCLVEDRLPVLSSQVIFDHARTAKGLDLAAPEAADVPADEAPDAPVMEAACGAVEAESGESAEGSINFTDKDPADPGPLSLSGNLLLTLAVGKKEARIENAFAQDRKPAASGPYKLTLREITRGAGSVTVSLEVSVKGNSPILHQRSPKGQYGFRLVDPKGTACAELESYSYVFGNGATSGSGENASFTLHAVEEPETAWPQTSTLRLTFSHVGDAEGPWSLVFVHPERIETRNYPIAIKDVPLP